MEAEGSWGRHKYFPSKEVHRPRGTGPSESWKETTSDWDIGSRRHGRSDRRHPWVSRDTRSGRGGNIGPDLLFYPSDTLPLRYTRSPSVRKREGKEETKKERGGSNPGGRELFRSRFNSSLRTPVTPDVFGTGTPDSHLSSVQRRSWRPIVVPSSGPVRENFLERYTFFKNFTEVKKNSQIMTDRAKPHYAKVKIT